jgi:hypothetical protein
MTAADGLSWATRFISAGDAMGSHPRQAKIFTSEFSAAHSAVFAMPRIDAE